MSTRLSILVTLQCRCRGGPTGTKSPLGLPELIEMYNAIGKLLRDHAKTGDRVDVFALEPFAGHRDALEEYLGKYPERVEILKTNPRHLSDPANVMLTFPGLDKPERTTFIGRAISWYEKCNQDFQEAPRDSFTESRMCLLLSLLLLEMRYLRGCDLRWVESEGADIEGGDVPCEAAGGGGDGASQSSPEGESQAPLLASFCLLLFCSCSLPRLLMTLVHRRWSSLQRPRRQQSFHPQACPRSRIKR